jgi:lysophospholipase L1-like esterase
VVEAVLLFQTTWKRLASVALVLGLTSSCADAEITSVQSPNTATAIENSDDAGPDEDAGQSHSTSQLAQSVMSAAGGGRQPWRIVPLGDSITQLTCTSQLLWQALREAGVQSFDMIGTSHSELDCGVQDADRDNEGHGGYLATDMVDDGKHASELSTWCEADKGDVVLLHLGTNDIAHSSFTATTILSAFSKILAKLRAVQPHVVVFVAQIIQMNISACSDCSERVLALNKQIPHWAKRESREQSPVYVVDQFSGFDPATDTADGIHPNKQGSQKMAIQWAAALFEHMKL